MLSLGELRVPALLENLRLVSAYLQGIGTRLQLTEKSLFDIELAIEEAATNAIFHAYAPGHPGDIALSAELEGEDVLRLVLRDWGEPLDPQRIPAFDPAAPVEARAEGGMGLHFINMLMDRVERQNRTQPDDPNILRLTKRIERLAPGQRPPDALRELNAMLSISKLMSADMPLEQLLRRMVNKLVEALDAERGTLYLIDQDRGELFSLILMEDTNKLHEIRVKVGEGIAGHVAATGEVLNIRNAQMDPRFNPDFDRITGFHSQTLLAAPMRNTQQKLIGVVQVLNKRGGPFRVRDERLLVAMASQAAVSIENARMHAREIEQRLVNQELETARRIQTSFLPQIVPQHPGWELAAYWRPMYDVAGDFYDFTLLPDGRLAVTIADVSGKGIPAALFMALSVTVMRFALSLGFAPADLLVRANQTIADSQQSMMFTTAFLAYLNLSNGEVQFASAGHNPPLHFRAETGQCHYLTAPGVAMGIFRNAVYEERVLPMNKGDVLVLYTDGITECNDAQHEEFGVERLETLVVEHAGLPAQALSDEIVRAVQAHAGGEGAFDDETLVIIRRR